MSSDAESHPPEGSLKHLLPDLRMSSSALFLLSSMPREAPSTSATAPCDGGAKRAAPCVGRPRSCYVENSSVSPASRACACRKKMFVAIHIRARSLLYALGDPAMEEVSTDRYSFIHSCENGYRLPLARSYLVCQSLHTRREGDCPATTLDVRLLGGAFVFVLIYSFIR